MKVKLFLDEWRFYTLEADPFYGKPNIEIPDELYERYSQTLGAVTAVQDELEAIYRESLPR